MLEFGDLTEDRLPPAPLQTAAGLWTLMSRKGIGARSALKLAARYRDWSELAAASPATLARVAGAAAAQLAGVPEPQAPLPQDDAYRAVGAFDDEFPSELRALPDGPAVVWLAGQLPSRTAVAIVGTRHPSPSGADTARRLGAAAAEQGLTVVSGLALGIDAAAHEGCLQAAGSTVAVLGGGVDRPTPAEHRSLARRIVEAGGALLSEQPPGSAPSARTLVARNRLQSALSAAVVVVECGLPSGTLHTARFALEQRRLLAVCAPENATDPASAGSRALADPEGMNPELLGARGHLIGELGRRRPIADLIVKGHDGLAPLWEAVHEQAGSGPLRA